MAGMIVAEFDSCDAIQLAGQPLQKFLLIHPVLKCFAAIDEDYGDFVVKLPAQFAVAIDVYFLPGKAAAAREFGETFFYHLAQVTSLSGIDYDLARVRHAAILSLAVWLCSSKNFPFGSAPFKSPVSDVDSVLNSSTTKGTKVHKGVS
jgi:hypothetical protein